MKDSKFLQNLKNSWFVHKLILVIALMLFTISILAFRIRPAYEQGVFLCVIAISNAFTGSLSFLFGITIPFTSSPASPSAETKSLVTCPKCGTQFDISGT